MGIFQYQEWGEENTASVKYPKVTEELLVHLPSYYIPPGPHTLAIFFLHLSLGFLAYALSDEIFRLAHPRAVCNVSAGPIA